MRELPTIRGTRPGAAPAGYVPRPYVYRGDVPLAKDPDAKLGRPLKPEPKQPVRHEFSPDKCGTPAGHQRHVYWHVPICDPCREAKNAYGSKLKRERKEARRAARSS